MNSEKKSNKSYSYLEEQLSSIQDERTKKSQDLEFSKSILVKRYVELIVELFKESTVETLDVNLDSLTIILLDGTLRVEWWSPFIRGRRYTLDKGDIYTSMLKNMPNTKQKMHEIEDILPPQTILSDIQDVFQQEPFNKYFLTEQYLNKLDITFNPKICEKN